MRVLLVVVSLFVVPAVAYAESAYEAGKRLAAAGDFAGAVAQFDQAAREKPQAKVYWNKGLAELKLRRGAAALASFQRAQSLDANLTFTDAAKFQDRMRRAQRLASGIPAAPPPVVVPAPLGPPPLPPAVRPVIVVRRGWPTYYYVLLGLGILVGLSIIGDIIRRVLR